MNTVIMCEYCARQFNRRTNYIRHLKTVHSRNSSGELVTVNERFTCSLCSKQYLSKCTMAYHIKTVHSKEKKCCPHCDFKTCYKSVLENHIKRHDENNKTPRNLLESRYKCSYCQSSFTKVSRLKFHKREKHNHVVKTPLITKKCPLCPFIAIGRHTKTINLHFKKSHNIDLKYENHNFNSEKDFNSWKDELEKKTLSSFTKRTTTHRNNGHSTTSYECHRSGIFKSESLNKRKLKSSGSCKINGFCPASIKSIVNDKGVQVVYLSSHIGHEGELKHMRPKKRLAVKLAGKKSCKKNMHKRIDDVGKILQDDTSNSGDTLLNPLIDVGSNSNGDIPQQVVRDISTSNVTSDLQEEKTELFKNMQKIINMIKSKDQVEWLKKEFERIQTTITAMDSEASSLFLVEGMEIGNIEIVISSLETLNPNEPDL